MLNYLLPSLNLESLMKVTILTSGGNMCWTKGANVLRYSSDGKFSNMFFFKTISTSHLIGRQYGNHRKDTTNL